MKVIKTESEEGVLEKVTFRAEAGETEAQLKVKTKAWVTASMPGMTWEEFFDKVDNLTPEMIAMRP